MADEQKPLDELAEQQDDDAAQEEKSKKPGGKLQLPLKKIIIFAAIGVVAIGAAYAVTTIVTAAPATPGEDKPGAETRLEQSAGKKPERARSAEAPLHTMESIIVNLAKSDGRRYLKTTITFKLKTEEGLKILEAERVPVVDKLNTLLSGKTIDEIDGAEKKIDLKREIRDELNNLLGTKDTIVDVLFTEFIIQ